MATEASDPTPIVGRLVRDELLGRVGRVMEVGASRVHLRPPNGGCEWTAETEHVTPLTTTSEELSARVAEINHDTSRGLR